MKLFKLLIIFLISTNVFAEILNGNDNKSSIVELNNQDIAKCQEQLYATASTDFYPIILLYGSNEPFSALFMPTYEKVAKSLHTKRAFFRYDAATANPEITSQCLRFNGALIVPTVFIAYKFIEDEVLTNPMIAGLGTKWDPQLHRAVSISEKELIKLITLPFPTGRKLIGQTVIRNKVHLSN